MFKKGGQRQKRDANFFLVEHRHFLHRLLIFVFVAPKCTKQSTSTWLTWFFHSHAGSPGPTDKGEARKRDKSIFGTAGKKAGAKLRHKLARSKVIDDQLGGPPKPDSPEENSSPSPSDEDFVQGKSRYLPCLGSSYEREFMIEENIEKKVHKPFYRMFFPWITTNSWGIQLTTLTAN